MHSTKPLRVIALSPHQDDIALSATQTLCSLANQLQSFELVSCFTLSEYSPYPAVYPPAIVTKIRMLEDLEFLHQLKIHHTKLTCLSQYDSPLRPEWQEGGDIHDSKLYSKLNVKEIEKYVKDITPKLIVHNDNDLIYLCPLGINHKDHVIVHGAALNAWATLPLVFYADTPYVFDLLSGEVIKLVELVEIKLQDKLHLLRLRQWPSIDRWLECISVYRSQFTIDHLREIGDTLIKRGGELLWANTKARHKLKSYGLLDEVFYEAKQFSLDVPAS